MSDAPETLNILMIDDEELLREGVRRSLDNFMISIAETSSELMASVECASTAEDGLAWLEDKSNQIDLILLDYKLPGKSGIDLLKELDPKTAPLVIMITAFANLETAVKATKLGAFDFLAKPFSPGDIRAAVTKAANQIVLRRKALEHEQEKRRLRFEFLSVLSHELKSPIAAVEGYLNILETSLEGDELRMIDRSKHRLKGMRQLVMDLLDLTRIESGEKKREIQLLNVKEIIENAIELQEHAAEERGISIKCEISGDIPFYADPYEIEVIANNLVSNAVKYNRDGGRVEIEISKDDKCLNLRVSDTGIGMTPEEKNKIFKEFVRIKNEDTRLVSGSGLGLSTLKKLVDLYEGEIEVESERGVGTTFALKLIESLHEKTPDK